MTDPGQQIPASEGGGDERDAVYRVYLATDARPAIRAAGDEALRAVVRDLGAYLCRQVSADMGSVPALGPDRRAPWQVCQAGDATRAGFQLYRHVMQAVAGNLLQALGFEPARAAGAPARIDRFLATATQQQVRQILLDLADHLEQVITDSDDITALATETTAGLPADMQDVGRGVSLSVALYHHAVQVIAVSTLYHIWEGLGISTSPALVPYAPRTAAAFGFSVN
jgi:hypothetical protein